MTKTQNLFFSCVDSRIQDQGSMYARFHLGTFFRGQALTFANALRRTLLSEMPGLIITDVTIEGANHEFATLPGVEETVLDILLNLKKLVFVPSNSNLVDLETFHATGFIKSRGPGTITAGDVKLPATVKCVDPHVHIATITTGGEFALRFNLQVHSPQYPVTIQTNFSVETKTFSISPNTKLVSNSPQNVTKNKAFDNVLGRAKGPQKFGDQLTFDMVPMPIQKVNYVIKALNAKQGSEYIVLEVWTDGSILPQETVQFALRNLTYLFFQFSNMSK